MAARSGHDQAGAGLDALVDRIVGGGIAGVEGDQNIGARDVRVRDRAGHELQAGKFARAGYIVTQIDELASRLNACDIRIYPPHRA